jgi:putative spermidine/putrescine transport system ATP-binding protein
VADFVGVTNRVPGLVSGGSAAVLGGRVELLPGSAGDGPATLLVRPEHLLVDRTTPNATVVSASFLGSHAKVVVAPDADAGGRPEAPLVVQVRSADVGSFSTGDRVCVRPTGAAALAVAAD